MLSVIDDICAERLLDSPTYVVYGVQKLSVVLSIVREKIWCRPECGWNSVWRIPGDMKLSFQAARSIG